MRRNRVEPDTIRPNSDQDQLSKATVTTTTTMQYVRKVQVVPLPQVIEQLQNDIDHSFKDTKVPNTPAMEVPNITTTHFLLITGYDIGDLFYGMNNLLVKFIHNSQLSTENSARVQKWLTNQLQSEQGFRGLVIDSVLVQQNNGRRRRQETKCLTTFIIRDIQVYFDQCDSCIDQRNLLLRKFLTNSSAFKIPLNLEINMNIPVSFNICSTSNISRWIAPMRLSDSLEAVSQSSTILPQLTSEPFSTIGTSILFDTSSEYTSSTKQFDLWHSFTSPAIMSSTTDYGFDLTTFESSSSSITSSINETEVESTSHFDLVTGMIKYTNNYSEPQPTTTPFNFDNLSSDQVSLISTESTLSSTLSYDLFSSSVRDFQDKNSTALGDDDSMSSTETNYNTSTELPTVTFETTDSSSTNDFDLTSLSSIAAFFSSSKPTIQTYYPKISTVIVSVRRTGFPQIPIRTVRRNTRLSTVFTSQPMTSFSKVSMQSSSNKPSITQSVRTKKPKLFSTPYGTPFQITVRAQTTKTPLLSSSYMSAVSNITLITRESRKKKTKYATTAIPTTILIKSSVNIPTTIKGKSTSSSFRLSQTTYQNSSSFITRKGRKRISTSAYETTSSKKSIFTVNYSKPQPTTTPFNFDNLSSDQVSLISTESTLSSTLSYDLFSSSVRDFQDKNSTALGDDDSMSSTETNYNTSTELPTVTFETTDSSSTNDFDLTSLSSIAAFFSSSKPTIQTYYPKISTVIVSVRRTGFPQIPIRTVRRNTRLSTVFTSQPMTSFSKVSMQSSSNKPSITQSVRTKKPKLFSTPYGTPFQITVRAQTTKTPLLSSSYMSAVSNITLITRESRKKKTKYATTAIPTTILIKSSVNIPTTIKDRFRTTQTSAKYLTTTSNTRYTTAQVSASSIISYTDYPLHATTDDDMMTSSTAYNVPETLSTNTNPTDSNKIISASEIPIFSTPSIMVDSTVLIPM
ncbi:unnamed protein product, partial [Didymodactylos carnosus]